MQEQKLNAFKEVTRDVLSRNYRLIPIIPPDAEPNPNLPKQKRDSFIRSRGKAPGRYLGGYWRPAFNWQKTTEADARLVYEHVGLRSVNLGVVLGDHPDLTDGAQLIAIDVDVTHSEANSRLVELLLHFLGSSAPRRLGNPSKAGTWYVVIRPSKSLSYASDSFIDAEGVQHKIEYLGSGRQSVIGGMHPCGEPYKFVDASLLEINVRNLPCLSDDMFEQLRQQVRDVMLGCGLTVGVSSRKNDVERHAEKTHKPLDEADASTVLLALKETRNVDLPRGAWVGFVKLFKAYCEPSLGLATIYEALLDYDDRWEEGPSDGGGTLRDILNETTTPYALDFDALKKAICRRMNADALSEWGHKLAGISARLDFDEVALEDCDYGTTEWPGNTERESEIRYQPAFADDMQPITKLNWLIKGVLPPTGLGVVYGAPGSGKSFFVLDLVASVACPDVLEWRGRKIVHCSVAVCFLEGGGNAANRVVALRQYRKLNFGRQLGIYTEALDLRSPRGKDVKDFCRGVKLAQPDVGLVVVDTLSRAMSGADENSSVDMTNLIAACKVISEYLNCLVLLVHHSGKDAGRGSRGHSSLLGAADFEMEISRPDKSEPLRIAKITKQKEGLDGIEFGFKLENVVLGTDDDGDPVSSCVPVFVDLVAAKKEKEKLPKGENEEAVMEAFAFCIETNHIKNETSIHGNSPGSLRLIKRQMLIEETAKRVDGSEKQRARKARDAIKSLIGRSAFFEFEDYVYDFDWI